MIVGEWSISPATAQEWSAEFNPNAADAKAWYTKWWAAQVRAYEKQDGWTFWSWKSDLGDWRWSYSAAVEAGVIPRDPGQAYNIGGC